MAVRNKTPFVPNKTYFITFTILGWKRVFISDKYFLLVFKWFDYMRQHYNNKIYGYVIMPNHIHVLIKITDLSPKISTLIFNAKRFLAYEIPKFLAEDKKVNLINFFKKNKDKEKAIHKVFTPRYDSLIIQSKKFFLEKLNYIHNNPCTAKWNLANNPEDYKYSSASNYILGKGAYDVDVEEF